MAIVEGQLHWTRDREADPPVPDQRPWHLAFADADATTDVVAVCGYLSDPNPETRELGDWLPAYRCYDCKIEITTRLGL